MKPTKSSQINTGARSLLIVGGVGSGKVLMWHAVPTGRWSGQAAADMYAGPLKKTLQKAHPGKRQFLVLEDNDPTGFKSKKGIRAKAEAKIKILEIPKRSPDLNVLDYAIWSEVNRRMRRQEKTWPKSKRESRARYAERLRRTAMSLPKAFITKSIGDMRRRCRRLLAAKGGFIEEGGKMNL